MKYMSILLGLIFCLDLCFSKDSVGNREVFLKEVTMENYMQRQKYYDKHHDGEIPGPDPGGVIWQNKGIQWGVVKDVLTKYLSNHDKHDMKSYFKMLKSKDLYERYCAYIMLMRLEKIDLESPRAVYYNVYDKPFTKGNVKNRVRILKKYPEILMEAPYLVEVYKR